MISFIAGTGAFAASFSFLASISFCTCLSTTSSSTFSKSKPISPKAVPSFNNSACPASSHAIFFILKRSTSLPAVNGRKGSDTIAKFAAIFNAILRIVAVLLSSVLMTFHGSVSARYLFPSRAKSITIPSASLNLYRSIEDAIFSGNSAKASKTS